MSRLGHSTINGGYLFPCATAKRSRDLPLFLPLLLRRIASIRSFVLQASAPLQRLLNRNLKM